MRNVWIFNHYIIPPFMESGHRHVKFANHLVHKGYSPVLFYSSYIHNLGVDVHKGNDKFSIESQEDVIYVGLKTRSYSGNKFNRILNMLDYFLGLFKYKKIIKKGVSKPEVIIASSVHPLACIAGIIVSQKLNIPCIIEIRDLWPLSLVEMGKIKEKMILTKIMFYGERWIYKKSDKLIFTMEGGKDYVKDRDWSSLINEEKIHHINNGIDLEQFHLEKNMFDYKDDVLDDNSVFKVIYTGTLGEANAPFFLVETAKHLIDYKNIKLLIFGDGPLKEKIEKYCKDENLTNVLIKGRVEKKYIPNILNKGNLNIFTGLRIDLYKYGISLNKLFDYLASGKPTVSNLKCNYDLLERYECGKTIDENTPEIFAKEILKFYNMDGKEYETFCENATLASENYDFSVLTRDLVGILES